MPRYPGMRYPGGTVQRSVLEKTDDYSQARTRYRSLPDAEKARLADAIGWELAQAADGNPQTTARSVRQSKRRSRQPRQP